LQLAELQRRFWLAVRTRGSPPPHLEDWLTESARQTPAERLAVYHLAYWQRQVTALASTFPKLEAELGKAACERLMLAYVEARPSTDPCIEWLGRGFVEFLAMRDLPAHPLGVARLEWAHVESLLAPNPHSVVELPRGLGPAFTECRLRLVPSLRVEHVRSSSFAAFAPDLHEAGEQSAMVHVAFFRPQLAVKYLALAADEARACALARQGATIALTCTAFSHLPETDAATRAAHVLANWFARGWVAHCGP
jgi:hypothetical protein